MAANVLGIVCYVISGYFVLTVSVLSFVSGQLSWVKWVMLLGFSIPALIALVCGFAFRKFKKKLRDLGIVLLASAATSAFMILSVVCVFSSSEYRKLMEPGTLDIFRDYVFGGCFLISLTLAGIVSLRAGLRIANRSPAPALSPGTPAEGHDPLQS